MSSSDPNHTQACRALVAQGIPSEFEEADATDIGTNPERIVEWGSVSLWAQYLNDNPGTTKRVNLRLPRLLAWLKTFAQNGVGPASVWGGDIKFKFISNKDSGTTTPVSSL